MATKTWLGAGTVTRGQLRWEITGTWATGDTASFAINGKALVLTVGTTATVDQIGADIVDMINGDDANGDETRSALGSAVGEFANLTASYSASANKITIVGDESGRPIGTVAVVATTAGDGNISSDGTGTVTESSPNHFSAAANWDGGVPADNDDIVFDNKAVSSCLYDLTPSSLTPTSITITKGFRYSIGLPEVNTSQSIPFDEFNTTYLTADGGGTVVIDAASANKIKMNFGAVSTAVIVRSTGSTDEPNTPPVLIKANHSSSTLTVEGGSVGVNYEPKVAGELATIHVNGRSPSVVIGTTTTLATLNVSSGTVVSDSSATTVSLSGGSIDYNGAGTITTLNVDGGVFSHLGTGTITTMYLAGGTLDCSRNSRARTITNFSMYAKSSLQDPLGTITFTNGMDIFCKPEDVVLDLPARRTYTLSAI